MLILSKWLPRTGRRCKKSTSLEVLLLFCIYLIQRRCRSCSDHDVFVFKNSFFLMLHSTCQIQIAQVYHELATIDLALLKEISLFVVLKRDICSRYLDSKSATVLSEPLIYLMSNLYYASMSA